MFQLQTKSFTFHETNKNIQTNQTSRPLRCHHQRSHCQWNCLLLPCSTDRYFVWACQVWSKKDFHQHGHGRNWGWTLIVEVVLIKRPRKPTRTERQKPPRQTSNLAGASDTFCWCWWNVLVVLVIRSAGADETLELVLMKRFVFRNGNENGRFLRREKLSENWILF